MDSDDRPIGTITLLVCFIVALVAICLEPFFRWWGRWRSWALVPFALSLSACQGFTPAPTATAAPVNLQPATQEVRKAVRVSAEIGASIARQASAIDRQRSALARQQLALRRAQLVLDGKTLVP